MSELRTEDLIPSTFKTSYTSQKRNLYVNHAYFVDRTKTYVFREEPGLGKALFEFDSEEDAKIMCENGYYDCDDYMGGSNWIERPLNGIVILFEDDVPCYYVPHEQVVEAKKADLLFHILYSEQF